MQHVNIDRIHTLLLVHPAAYLGQGDILTSGEVDLGKTFVSPVGTQFEEKRLSMQIGPWHAKAIPGFIWFPETLMLLLVGGKQTSPTHSPA